MGFFIVLEGIEGCGKTTQAGLLGRYLEARGIPCTLTREPGGTPVGEEIRRIFLHSGHADMLPITELCLVTAARAQHIHQVIKPALDAGRVVICDRFFSATVAYQGYAGGIPLDLIAASHALFCNALQPDVSVLFDCPASVGLGRSRRRNAAAGSGQSEGRFEDKALAFHERVRQGYRTLAAESPEHWIVIRADDTCAAVHRDVCEKVLPLLRDRGYAV